MTITLLGTGTSQGVPVIACDCDVCTSADPRDKRLRCAALVTDGTTNILLDAGPDFRQQMLRAGVRHLDAILLTHQHNDHIAGLDDVRSFNFRQGGDMPIYGLPHVLDDISRRFEYAFQENPYPGAPRFSLQPIQAGQHLRIGTITLQTIGIMHGSLPILGFRFGNIAYLTDVKYLPDDSMTRLTGLQTLIISALHFTPHHAHLTVSEALAYIRLLAPMRACLIHASHHIGLHATLQAGLPDGVTLGYDGLSF